MDDFREVEPRAIATSEPQAGVDKQLLDKLLVEAFAVSENAANKDIVLVIGNTGVGKSTTINYLLGSSMEVQERGAQDVIVVKSGAEEHAVIGHELTNSQTLYPSIFRMPDNDYYLCDCPGFVDTRGLEYEISAALSTKMVINAAHAIKNIVVVIPQGAMVGEARAAGLRSIFETLKKLLGQMHKAEKDIINLDYLKKAITFVITKPGFTITGRKIDIRKLLDQIRGERIHLKTEDSQNIVFMCDLMLSSNSLIEIDPLDDGESRIRLMNCFNQSIPLPPQDFCLPAAENAQRVLQDMLCEIASEGIALLTDLVNQQHIIRDQTEVKLMVEKEISLLDKKISETRNGAYFYQLPWFLKENRDAAEVKERQMYQELQSCKQQKKWAKENFDRLERDYNSHVPKIKQQCNLDEANKNKLDRAESNYNGSPQSTYFHNAWKAAKESYDAHHQVYFDYYWFVYDVARIAKEDARDEYENIVSKNERANSNHDKSLRHSEDIQQLCNQERATHNQHIQNQIALFEQQKITPVMKLCHANSALHAACLIFTKSKILLPNKLPDYLLLIKIATILGDSLRPEIQQFLTLIHPVYAPVFIKILHQDIASNQNADAEFALAMCCQHGFGIVRNPENAVIYLKAAANHGHAEAQFLMGELTEKEDALSSARFYQRASQQNHVKAQKRLGKFIDEQIAAALHKPYSQCFIGVCLEEGIYLKPDIVLAKKYYKNSAKQKFLPAMHRLGLLYECGKGVPLNILKAMRNYHGAAIHIDDAKHRLERLLADLKRKAAANQAREQYLLSICYFEGIGINQNHEERIKYLRWASDNKQPDPDAQFSLARCYEHGEYTEKDALQALSYYKKSADGGNQFAQIALGRMVKSIIDLAKQGNSYAEYQLGLCYLEGYFVPIDYAESFRYFSASAKAKQQEHYHVAVYYIGWFYEHGKGGVTQNLLTAMEYYHFAASRVFSAKLCLEKLLIELKRNAAANRSDGQYLLSVCYAKGIGVNKNSGEAFNYLKLAADNKQPNSEAQFFLAECYEEPTRRDFVEALFYYKKSAEAKNARAHEALKRLVCNITEAAHQGDSWAQYQLGVCYYEGYYVDKNYKKSFDHLLAVAKAEKPPCHLALYYIGLWFFEVGVHVPQNILAAMHYYHRATDSPLAMSRLQQLLKTLKHNADTRLIPEEQYRLSICYSKGIGVEKNHKMRLHYLNLAADQNHPNAQFLLGKGYEKGNKAIKQDFVRALFYYKKSAENKNKEARVALKSLVKIIQQGAKEGVPLAEYQLGVCYLEGYYFGKKDNQSFKYFSNAASKNFARAKFQVALCYENGSGVTENKIEALRWYKAADQDGIATAGQRAQSLLASIHGMASGGNASDQYFLGICYDEGLGGLNIDHGLAKNWLRLSTKQKYAPAYERLSIFYAAGKAGNLDSNLSKKHQEKSLKYMKKAEKYGSGSASFFLAEQREKGVGGVKQNSEKAKKHYQLANARHYPGAQDALGRFDESENSESSSEKCSIM